MESNETGLTSLTDILESTITGIPAPVRKNFFKALGQLSTAAVNIPVAWLEGKSAEIRASTEARIKIIRKEAEIISEKIEVPQEYITKASSKFAAKVINEQINLDKTILNAAKELIENKKLENFENKTDDISDDWLNEFENFARIKSSKEMQNVFGKILAGEIVRPGTFSIKTIRLISQLDNQAAKLFQIFCSLTISFRVIDNILDARVISFSGNAATNTLIPFGLSFDSLNILNEYGLIISDYNSWMDYSACILNEQNQLGAVLRFQNKDYGLVPSDIEKFEKNLRLYGVSLTKAGKELLDIIELKDDNDAYKASLIDFFNSKYLNLVEINKA